LDFSLEKLMGETGENEIAHIVSRKKKAVEKPAKEEEGIQRRKIREKKKPKKNPQFGGGKKPPIERARWEKGSRVKRSQEEKAPQEKSEWRNLAGEKGHKGD